MTNSTQDGRKRVHIPAKRFTPELTYCSDMVGICPKIGRIDIGTHLVDCLQFNGKAIPGADDLVFKMAAYRYMKVYFTWPGYVGSETLKSIDLHAGGDPTRGSVVSKIALLFLKFMKTCEPLKLHPSVKGWRIGDRGLSPENVFFNFLVNSYENVWQVDCDIVL